MAITKPKHMANAFPHRRVGKHFNIISSFHSFALEQSSYFRNQNSISPSEKDSGRATLDLFDVAIYPGHGTNVISMKTHQTRFNNYL